MNTIGDMILGGNTIGAIDYMQRINASAVMAAQRLVADGSGNCLDLPRWMSTKSTVASLGRRLSR